MFAYYGSAVRDEGVWIQHPRSLIVSVDPDEFASLLGTAGYFVPAYFGGTGWLARDLVEPDWEEVAELLDTSYRRTASPKLVAELTQRGTRS